MKQPCKLFSGYVSCFQLIDNYTKTQLQRDVINVPDQQKTDAVLFREGPGAGWTSGFHSNYLLQALLRAYFPRTRMLIGPYVSFI